MLISPPFLPSRQENESEEAWLDRCMDGGHPGDGAYPISFNLGWHGGIHLRAPLTNGQSEPVRAIADGTIVFVRQATARVEDPSHALNYRGWTDNGCVVIRHDTEIGQGPSATVSFFSITMHLSKVDPAAKVGKPVWRKSAIGLAGQIDGSIERKIHFEIVCDDANLARLIGRTSGDLRTSIDGRLDAVYGQMYFLLPSGTRFFAQKPLDHLAAAHIQPPKPNPHAALPPVQALQASYTSPADTPLVVCLRYAGGEGAAGHRGSAYLQTLRLDSTSLGNALEEIDGEYNLYVRANEISKAYPQDARPAPSAVYELLRFGRIVNTEHETLTPGDVPHWRKVRYPGGEGWVNLNALGIRKFSDADFPHWQQWRIVDDSQDQDSRCDSSVLRGWLDISGDGRVDPIEAAARLGDAMLIPKFARTICKFPTEWDGVTIDQRWGWLKVRTDENPTPFTDEDFGRLRAHIQALAFFPGDTGLPAKHWHFQPKAFIRHFRSCGWLNDKEILRCIPLVYQANRGNRLTPIIQNSISNSVARARLNERSAATLMRIAIKYGLSGRRLAHFLSQVYQETGVLRWAQELATGEEYEGRRDLGNSQKGDGKRFKGRGLIQTTGRANYGAYSSYHGRTRGDSFTIEPNNQLISSNPYYAADAAGMYWVARNIGGGRSNISRLADMGVDESNIRRVTKNVNGAEDALWTGLVARRSHTKVTAFVLLDDLNALSPEKVRADV